MWTIPLSALTRAALRDRVTLGWSLVFPILLALILGEAVTSEGYADRLLGGVVFLSAVFFATSGTAFVVLGQRNRGLYKLLLTTPFPVPRFVGVLTLSRALVSLACVLVVALVSALALGVTLSAPALLLLVPTALLALVPFSLLGFCFGNLASNEAQTAALNNLVNLPAMFLTTALIGASSLPTWMGTLARWLPFEHTLAALRAALAGDGAAILGELPWVFGFSAAALLLAVLTFRWDPQAPVRLGWPEGRAG